MNHYYIPTNFPQYNDMLFVFLTDEVGTTWICKTLWLALFGDNPPKSHISKIAVPDPKQPFWQVRYYKLGETEVLRLLELSTTKPYLDYTQSTAAPAYLLKFILEHIKPEKPQPQPIETEAPKQKTKLRKRKLRKELTA